MTWIYITGINPFESALNPVRQLLVILRYTCYYCTMGNILLFWSLLWFIGIMAGRTIYFSSLAPWTAPGDAVRTSSQTGGFQVSASLIPLRAVSQVWHLQQRVTQARGQTTINCFAGLFKPSDQPEGRFPRPGTVFIIWLLFLAFCFKWDRFFSVCVC